MSLDSSAIHDLLSPVSHMCFSADLILKRHQSTLDNETVVLFAFLRESAYRLQDLLGGLQTYGQLVGLRSPFRRCDANLLLDTALAMGQFTRDGVKIARTGHRRGTRRRDPPTCMDAGRFCW